MIVSIVKTFLWLISITYFSIFAIPFLLYFKKEDLYLSFCYFNYIFSSLLGLEIFYNENIEYEKTIIISNHQSLFDILIAFIFQVYNNRIYEFCLKKTISFFPGIGWWCRIMSFPILSRTKKDIEKLRNHNTRNSILIYPEGTRITKKKYQDSISFSKKNNIPLSNYSLIPKSKGCITLLENKNIERLTFSFIFYHNSNHRLINFFGNFNFPEKVYIYNKSYLKKDIDISPEVCKEFLQKEFYNINSIVPIIKENTQKLYVETNLKIKIITFLVFVFSFLVIKIDFIFKFFLKIKESIYKN
jgi:hypothetical protein